MLILDIIVSILQSALFAYTITCCVDKNYKEGTVKNGKLIFLIILFSINGQVFTDTFGESQVMALFVNHIVALFITALFFRKSILNSIVANSIVYTIILLFNIVFGSLIFETIATIVPLKYMDYVKAFIIYIPEIVLILYYIKHISIIKHIYKYIINEHFSIGFIMTTFLGDFIMTFYLLHLGDKSQIVKNIINLIFFMVCLIILVYISKIYIKSEDISKLNKALELKNTDLRKIKHDYGAQISYLYGLCLMNRFDDLKKALKNIIEDNDNVPSAVEINEDNNSLLSLALKPALEKGIHVIIKSNYDTRVCVMPEIELYRVLSNIVNNALNVMHDEGIIIANAYEQVDNIIIKIENNGPKIDEKFREKIFEPGFTTKENNEKNHGFGLSIVKDLIESYNGKISLKSNDISTEFKIILPIK